jgi:hypothetical protein
MSRTSFELVPRHIALVGFALVAASLIYVRRQASPLIEAGIVTRAETDGFVKWAIGLFAVAAIAMWLLQGLAANSNPACLLRVPPAGSAALGLWLLHTIFSAILLWWLWARDGADFLARIAPAFMSGARHKFHYTPRQLRLVITGLVVLLPLWIIGFQMVMPIDNLCRAI